MALHPLLPPPEKETAQTGERVRGKPWPAALAASLLPGIVCLPAALTAGFERPPLGGAEGLGGQGAPRPPGRPFGLRSLPPLEMGAQPAFHFGADNGINGMESVTPLRMKL